MTLLFNTDSYKMSHHAMYPPWTRHVGSYFESRGGEYNHTCFFGLQYILKKYLEGTRVTEKDIQDADWFASIHFSQNDVPPVCGWDRIVDEHDGKLPVRIRAVDEGSVIPHSNILLDIENTDPKLPWLTNYLETILVQLWYPCTIATQSMMSYLQLQQYGEQYGDKGDVRYRLHDFGLRGSTSMESAAIGGAAHLIHFRGSDNIPAMRMLERYYDHKGIAGYSVPAAEHSTITAWEHEVDAYKHILEHFDRGIVSIVADTYNVYNACRMFGDKLFEQVEYRYDEDEDAKLVVRPDSGNPTEVILKCLQILASRFGMHEDVDGRMLLNYKVRILQGDGITRHTMEGIIRGVMDAGWSFRNLIFGSGGGLLQDCNRDTMKFAMKCSWVDVKGVVREVRKNPITDKGKLSKKGKMQLVFRDGEYKTIKDTNPKDGLLKEVFRDGEITRFTNLDEIRERADKEMRRVCV